MRGALLEVKGLKSGYGDAKVLHGIDLLAYAGGVTAIIGSNGAGKTTLFRALSGLLGRTSGEIVLDGLPISALPAHQRVAHGLIMVPEGRLIFATMSVEENLRAGAITQRVPFGNSSVLKRVYELFPRLAQRRRQAGGTLSGGEQQMLALGRGLMGNPQLLLLDEPTLGLAPAIADQIFELVPAFVEMGASVLIAEQDVYRTLEIASNAYVLENGRISLQGTGKSLLDDPGVRTAYLGH